MISEGRARDLLERWARNNGMRDKLVARAYEAGISKREISVLTGIARTTIDRIITRHVPELFSPREAGIVAPRRPADVSRETSAVEVGEVGVEAAEHGQDRDAEAPCPAPVS